MLITRNLKYKRPRIKAEAQERLVRISSRIFKKDIVDSNERFWFQILTHIFGNKNFH